MTTALRLEPPTRSHPMFSLEAEKSVLGAMMIDPARAMDAAMALDDWMFYHDGHRRLYRVACKLWEDHRAVEAVSLVEALKASGDYDAVGGIEYVSMLWDYVPTAANVEHHIGIVARHAIRRRLAEQAEKVQMMVRHDAESPIETLRVEAERLIREAAPTKLSAAGSGFVVAKSLLWPEMQRLERIGKGEYEDRGIKTGLRDVDEKLVGMKRGDFVIIAGRPSMGKSAMGVCNIAADVSIRQRKSVAIFSVETRKDALIRRLLASEARVNMFAIERRRGIADGEYSRLSEGAGFINSATLYVDHTPGLTLDQMRMKLREQVRTHGPVELVVVDYLQMMTHTKAKDTYAEVSAISKGLKEIAGEFDVVMVALSQLSRAVEARPDKRPMMSDLRESGRIEQDADVIMLLYRPEYYFPTGMPVKRGKDVETIDVTGKAEVILAKVRDGQTGSVHVAWEGAYTHFEDLGGFR